MNIQLPTTALGPNDPDDGDAGRQQRGKVIAERARIVKTKAGFFKVPSQSSSAFYHVLPVNNEVVCTCPDYENRELPCKHIYAAKVYIGGIDDEQQVEVKPRPRYKRDETAFDQAQIHEQELFAKLLRALCDTIEQPPQQMGRPRLPLSDMVYATGLRIYSTKSVRRAMTDVRNAQANGHIDQTPSYATIARYLRKPELTPLLKDLIELSATPLSGVEQDFAADSSGFSTSVYDRWFDHKWGREKKRVRWIKAHIMAGVRTNIVTAAEVTATATHDSKYLGPLVKTTVQNFKAREISGDKAYLSRENFHVIDDAGATPYIPFKTNSLPEPIVGKRDPLWTRLYHYYQFNRADFDAHYHKRSNVETSFHMIKTKFGGAVRSKNETAQINEVLTKVLANNLCVLVHSMYALGVIPAFADDLQLP